ncbi:hypothetical protein UFOVP1382_142 [uncultured Caudovirales phage]|uniref:Uncharacterized protein n=1 Tax=uncultured Caudovirales phage TaxID=2100421 RepID=A0A6J5S553_9CAUD|nr:hypothetical protein UFOVP1382_142 [uncultured Caudovirales phage]
MSTSIVAIGESKLKVRWHEPLFSSAFAIAMSGLGDGIARGFVPTFPGGMVIRFAPEDGVSVLRARSAGTDFTTTYVETANLDLTLTPFAGTTVYIGFAPNYTEGATTAAAIRAYSLAEYTANAGTHGICWLGSVDVPANPGPILASHYDATSRTFTWAPHDDDYNAQWHRVNVDGDFFSPHWWKIVSQSGVAAFEVQSGVIGAVPQSAHIYLDGVTTGNDDIFVHAGDVALVKAGDDLSVSFKGKTTGAFAATGVGMKVIFYGPDMVVVSQVFFDAGISGTVGWKRYRKTIPVPVGAYHAVAGIWVNNLSAGHLYVEGIRVLAQSTASGKMADADAGHAQRPLDVPMLRFVTHGSYLSRRLDVYAALDVSGSGEDGLVFMPVDTNASAGATYYRLQFGESGKEMLSTFWGVVSVTGSIATGGNIDALSGTFGGGFGFSGVTISATGSIEADSFVKAGGGYGFSGVTLSATGDIWGDGSIKGGSTLETAGSQHIDGTGTRKWGTVASPDVRYLHLHAMVEDAYVEPGSAVAAIGAESVAHNGYKRKVVTFSGITDSAGFAFWVPPGAYVEDITILSSLSDLAGTTFQWQIVELFAEASPAGAPFDSGTEVVTLKAQGVTVAPFMPSAAIAKWLVFGLAVTGFGTAPSRDVLGIRIKLRVASLEDALYITP